MSKKNSKFFEKKKDWSEIKDSLLRCYIRPYFQKVLRSGKPILYVDCFAGKGKFEDGKPGSPIIALDARKDSLNITRASNAQIETYFIDLNYASDLEINLASYEESYWKPYIVSGKFEDKIIEILQHRHDVNVFLYIDPYGIQALNMELFNKINSYVFKSFEMLINFNSFGFIREACRALKVDYTKDAALADLDDLVEYSPAKVDSSKKSIDLLNRIADGTYWQKIIQDISNGLIDGYQAEEQLSVSYKQRLRKRYTYVLDMPIQIKRTNHPKYRMVHVCNHEQGCLLMAQNMLKRTDELVVNIQQHGQITLFDWMTNVNTTASGEMITQDAVKEKLLSHLRSYNRDIRLNILIADFYTCYGLYGYQSMITDALQELEQEGYITIIRNPSVSAKTGKPLTYMTEEKDRTVTIRRVKNA